MLNRRMVIAAFALMLPSFVLAQAGAGANAKAEQQVLQAEKDRFAAMVKVDEAALTRLLGDDLTYTHSSALFQNKAEFIADLKAGNIKYVSVTPSESDWKVRLYGTMAIVNGLAAVNVIDRGNDLKFRVRYTTAHMNRGGAWQMVSWQATRLPQ